MGLLNEVLERVHAEGPFRGWKHETSAGTIDLRHLTSSARMVADYTRGLVAGVAEDNHRVATRAAFAVMQNLYPIVEALDSDAAKYLAQAAEALRQ